MKKLFIFLLPFLLIGCAASTASLVYNPDNLPAETLATIENSNEYSIVWIEGQWGEDLGGSFTSFAPGTHIIDWVKTGLDDVGVVVVTREVARGSLVMTLEAGKKYRIIRAENAFANASMIDIETGKIVSKGCQNPKRCEELKGEILSN